MTSITQGMATLWVEGTARRISEVDVSRGPGGCVRIELLAPLYTGEPDTSAADLLLFELDPQAASDLAKALARQLAADEGDTR